MADNLPVGAAWCRLWTDDDHSFGYVDAATPEIGIGVRRDDRRRGIGSALVAELIEQARLRGVRQLSLSVEPDNPAARLYRKFGFEKIGTCGGAWTMLLDLRNGFNV